MGNTCFLNATLQCITHTVPLFLKLHSTDHSTPCSCMGNFIQPFIIVQRFFFSDGLFHFSLHDYDCWQPADNKDGFCSFCALKEHVDGSIRRSGSVIMPVKFRDNLRSILSSWTFACLFDSPHYSCCLYICFSLIHILMLPFSIQLILLFI